MNPLGVLEAVLGVLEGVTQAFERKPPQTVRRKPSKEVTRKRIAWGVCSCLIWFILLAGVGAVVWTFCFLYTHK
ncbi:MAG: hypothetical protein AB9869_34930 [Verrucomicrobiia bacterium]